MVYLSQGVTYCGDSKASTLTMANVPWHEEVIGFVEQLTEMLPDYEIASEHEHSNCLLVANKKVSTLLYTGELGYDGPLYDGFFHMTDDMLGPSPMHIQY